MRAVANQEIQGCRESHLVGEKSTRDEQSDRRHHERGHISFFVPIESRRDKEPNLIQHQRRSEEDAADERHLQIHVERISGICEYELRIQMMVLQRERDGPLHQVVNPLVVPIRDAEAAKHRQD